MTRRAGAAIPLLLLFIGCSSRELSRSRATDLITGDSAFKDPVTTLSLQDEGLRHGNRDAGEAEGIWKTSMGNDFHNRYTLTPKGLQYFARDFSAREEVPLAQPTRRELLEVTGITTPPLGGEGLREALFTWQYAGLSPVVARYTGETSVIHKGEALFQRFDDGWRLQKLELNESEDRVPVQWPPEPMPGHIKGLQASMLQAWLTHKPNFRPAESKDCDCDQDLVAMRQSWENPHPYYVLADFNGDGHEDLAVILLDSQSTHEMGWSAALAVFNGPLQAGMSPAFFQEHVGSPKGSLLFHNSAVPLLIGAWESSGSSLEPKGESYLLRVGG